MTPDIEGLERPDEEVDPDWDKTVFDPETGKWLTIKEARRVAQSRTLSIYDLADLTGEMPPSDRKLSEPPEDPGTVFDPVTGEDVSVEEARRRAVVRVSDAENGIGLIEKDVGKAVQTEDGTEIGEVVRVTAQEAYLHIFTYKIVSPVAIRVTDDYVRVKYPQ